VNPFEGRFVVHEGEALKASIPASVPAGGISKGSLILTNQRLAIVGDTKGELGRTYELESINDIEAEFKRLPNRFATGINIILEDKGVLYLEVQFKAVDFGFDEFKLAFSNLRESRLRSRDGKVTVRKALSGDSRGIAVVHVDTWRTAYRGLVPAEYLASMEYGRSESMWERVLLDPKGGSVYVAEQGSDIVGFAAYGPERSSDPFYKGELYAIYVLAGKQRRGVGTQLLRSVAISLRSMGMESMIVWVLEDNPWGRFYESLQGRRVRNRETKVGGVSLTEVSYGWSDIDKLLALVETRLAGMEEKVRPDVMPVQNSADYPLM
jgi:GNAT superfamily N-acetyltransferase